LCEFLRDTEERNTVKRWMLATRIEIVTSAELAAREPV